MESLAAILPTLLLVYVVEKYYKLNFFDLEAYSLTETLLLKFSQTASQIVDNSNSIDDEFRFKTFNLPANLSFLKDPSEQLISLPPKEKAFIDILNTKEAAIGDKKLINSLQFLIRTVSFLDSDDFNDVIDNILTLNMLLAGFNVDDRDQLFSKFRLENFRNAKFEVQNFGEEVLLLSNELVYMMYQLAINRFVVFKVLELYREMAYNENLFRLISYSESCEILITQDNKFKGLALS